MIFDTAHEVLGSPSKNPKYLNIYQVMKISMENRQVTDDMDIYRYQIVLDYGMNARYPKIGSASSNARIYKFTPPKDPVRYVGPCSLRGTCNSLDEKGSCDCFEGYIGDDCSILHVMTM